MNKYHSLLLTTALLLGSTQLLGAETYPLYVPTTKSVITSNDIIKIENGQLQFHGKKIFDEEGNIDIAFNIDNKVFYFTTKESANNATYVLKDESGKEIRKFEGSRILVLNNEDSLPLILVQIQQDNNKFDNIYKFDGKEVKLISKNFQRYQNEFYGAGCQIIPFGNSHYAPIRSVATGETKQLNTLHPTKHFMSKPNPEELQIITTSGTNIIYTYMDSDDNPVIEAYNTKTSESKTIARGDGLFQIWHSGYNKVLRILKDKTLWQEATNTGIAPVSAYDNKESTFLDLTSLNEVTLNPKDFNKIILTSNIQGYTIKSVTFDISSIQKYIDRHNDGHPLF